MSKQCFTILSSCSFENNDFFPTLSSPGRVPEHLNDRDFLLKLNFLATERKDCTILYFLTEQYCVF